jgi:hypothetical protein
MALLHNHIETCVGSDLVGPQRAGEIGPEIRRNMPLLAQVVSYEETF